MSIHIEAEKGQVADRILLPGDPLRAQFVAENFLTDAKCYNKVRNMFGFTGLYKGMKVSVQGTGMGMPSLSIYVNELFDFYGVQKAIRIGTAGSIQKEVELRSVVMAMSACTDSGINNHRFSGLSFAPTAHWELLKKAYDSAVALNQKVSIGTIFSSDIFYDTASNWKRFAAYGALAVEMETAELYSLAAQYKREALGIFTISDSMVTGETTSAEDRQKTFTAMMQIALDAITK
ncbi:MAG: purine-nucleoside phosphorylase [Spirochaetaceae bacterium]|nr:purine-nucleoside phosphorylase [Spirochaetaceae bacterium]